MAIAKPLIMLARSRPTTTSLLAASRIRTSTPATVALFSTSSPRAATPAGPPPAGFRMDKPKRWDEQPENALDKAGRYFLMTEMLRGMYVVLEQFFRPP